MRAVLCIGLHNSHGKTIAPRLIADGGEVVVAEALTDGARLDTLGKIVTYLARLRPVGLFDVEIASDGVPVVAEDPLTEVPEFAAAVLTARGWRAPGTGREPARRR